MPLRSGNSSSKGARRRLRLALVATAALALAVAGTSSGASPYQTPLYLTGGPSSAVTTAFDLLTSAGPTASSAPTLAWAAGGANPISGTFNYLVAEKSSAGAYTASPTVSTGSSISASTVTVTMPANLTGATAYV